MNAWDLSALVRAHETVNRFELSYEEAKAQLEGALKLQQWLCAEERHNAEVNRWLEAERKWNLTRHLIENEPTWAAAERGWLKMRELSPNLDGVSEFIQLSPILQARYAAFADAAREDV